MRILCSILRNIREYKNKKMNASSICNSDIQANESTFKILICSSNMGNAEPSLSSMKAWIPERGNCDNVQVLLDQESIQADCKFDLVVIGMQEATWDKKKKANDEESSDEEESPDSDWSLAEKNRASVKDEETTTLRNMEQKVLGPDYISIVQEIRGQMQLHIFAHKAIAPLIDGIKVSGANTGIGNVMNNKGGIVVSFDLQRTRLTFLSAHLAAHEGKSHYKRRCDDIENILRSSRTFDLSKEINLAISSHHMFILGDLNFRTKFESSDEDDATMKNERLEKALKLIEVKDWISLYSYDELSEGLKNGDLLADFQTLPCHFSPTFKVKRSAGFEYNPQRTPSYTDRILYKSAQGLQSHVEQFAYEPCVDFITSDHKPIRGAFLIKLNDTIEPIVLPSTFDLIFSEVECSDLLSRDVNGYSDPYLKFMWDAITLKVASAVSREENGWPHSKIQNKTLNPEWKGKKLVLKSISCIVHCEAVIYVVVKDYDRFSGDDRLGVLSLNVQELISMEEGKSNKELVFDKPIEYLGKHAGRIKFKLEVIGDWK